MSSVQIPNLPAVANLSGAELLEAVQAGSSVKVSLNQIGALLGIGPVSFPLAVAIGGTGTTTSTGTGSVVLSNGPTVTFGLGTVGVPSISFTGDTNTGIWSPGADTIAFSTGGVERMRIDSAGEVGIGTTNPLRPLHIVTSGAIPAAMYLQNDTGDASVFLRSQDTGLNTVFFGDTTDFQAGLIQYAHTTNDLIARSAGAMLFQTGGSPERMRIDSTGNVGIGVAAPTFRLHVETNTDTNAGAFIRNNNTGTGASGSLFVASLVGNISLRAHSAAHSSWPNSTLITSDAGFTGGLNIVQNGANPIKLWTNGTERMRIDSVGNVGIGTASPTNFGAGYTNTVVFGTAGGIFQARSGGAGLVDFRMQADTNAILDVNSNHPLTFRTNATERMRLDTLGNLGINSATPLTKLDARNPDAFNSVVSDTTLNNNTNTVARFSFATDPASPITAGTGVAIALSPTPSRGETFLVSSHPSTSKDASEFSVWVTSGAVASRAATIDNSGNFGIGVATPASRLSVVESNTDNVTVGVWNSSAYGTGNQLSRIQLGKLESATYQPMGIIQAAPDSNASSSAGNLAFHTRSASATAERYRIGSLGQFGIGGANFGTAGQAFISGGPSAATSWGTLGLAGGGTGVTTAPAAAAVLYGYTATATAAGTTVLTNTSSQYQLFTGATTQTITLPVTSTLATGWTFHIVNASTGNLTVNSSGGNLVATVIPGTTVMVTCILTSGTTAASWEFGYTDFNTLTGTGSVVMSDGATAAFALGAVGTPSITFTGDLNTGIWSPAADTVAVSTNGAERMRIDSAGVISQPNAVSGSGSIVGEQTFRLTADVTAFGPAIGDFFGANSAISLEASSVYEVTIYAVFTKTTAGTATFTLTASSAPTRMVGSYQGSPITGIAAGADTSSFTGSQGATTAAFAATGSLTTAVNHAYQFRVQVQTNGAANFRLQLTQSAGTATPLAGSYYTVKKISATTGTFVA